MPDGEGVPEVEDGEDQADELPQRHDQRDGQGGALRGQDEDPPDADVSGKGAELREKEPKKKEDWRIREDDALPPAMLRGCTWLAVTSPKDNFFWRVSAGLEASLTWGQLDILFYF